MAITLDRTKRAITLDRAMALARSDEPLPDEWLHRVERIEQAPSKTYVAALGAALLAKATDSRVDSLARTPDAGPNGYAIRGVGEYMASEAARYGFHLGAPGRWPLNNSPFYRNADRIDRFTNIRAADQPFYEDLVRYLQDLNRLDEEEALLGLAAFLRRRIAYVEQMSAELAAIAAAQGGPYAEVVEIAKLFCNEDTEGGKRGQALVAALFDCVYETVDLASINNPRPLDVRVRDEEVGDQDYIVLGAEVKQVAVGEDTALHLAEEARALDCDKALLVAIAPDQEPLDRIGLRQTGLDRYGVLLEVVESVEELFASVTLHSPLAGGDVSERFPANYAARLQEHEVSMEGQRRWAGLAAGLSQAPGAD